MMKKNGRAYIAQQYNGMTPERLVLAMYEGALANLERARDALSEGRVAARGEAVSKAMAIVGELSAVLDRNAGGELAERLAELYDYVMRRMVFGNLHGDDAAFEESHRLIATVRDGWAEMLEAQAAAKAKEAQSEAQARPSLSISL